MTGIARLFYIFLCAFLLELKEYNLINVSCFMRVNRCSYSYKYIYVDTDTDTYIVYMVDAVADTFINCIDG